jgi:hypothetical protein
MSKNGCKDVAGGWFTTAPVTACVALLNIGVGIGVIEATF